MRDCIFHILTCLLLSGFASAYSQLELSFTSKYKDNYYQLDSVLIENINSGSWTVNYYPDTLLQLIITGIEELQNPEELRIALNQNYPNPFEDKTKFDIYLLENEKLNICIYNVLGKLLLNYEQLMQSGNHSFTFSGGGEEIYFLVAKTPGYSSAIKMINIGSRINDMRLTLDYNGYSPINEYNYDPINKNGYSQINASGYKPPGKLKSGLNEFEYNPGDSLMFVGYMTNDTGRVIADTIIDRPKQSKTICFQFEKKHRIAIIMYHDITDSVPGNDYERNSNDFANDMKFVLDDNYQLLSMNDLLLLQSGILKLYSDGIIITFDDGYESNYTKAFTLLSEYDIPASFFIVPEWIGDSIYMTWPEVWQISQYVNNDGIMPFIIGSHTSSHPYLEQSAQYFTDHQDYLDFLYTELEDSRSWIVDITGQSDIFLALPFGDGANNIDIINTAVSCGYKGIRTSIYDSFAPEEMNLFALPCISILSNDSIEFIEEFFEYW
jgi:peptidoglycan/xylan/chitin deacetylase (PgdA/CDA1 family)